MEIGVWFGILLSAVLAFLLGSFMDSHSIGISLLSL